MKLSRTKDGAKAHYLHVVRFCAVLATVGAVVITVILLTQSLLAHRNEKYNKEYVECRSVFGRITMEDRVKDESSIALTSVSNNDSFEAESATLGNLQPGDILVTMSTHTLGYRHGHAALVIDENTTLESTVIGTESEFCPVSAWRTYADYAVLRVKDAPPGLRQAVAEYAGINLYGMPYNLTAGIWGDKTADLNTERIPVQCAYLVWCAWNAFGYDLDSDGGRIVTPADLLESELVEIVESRGINR